MVRSLSREGHTLSFAEAGRGDPPLVFVHGFAADHLHFAPQLGYFAPSHRVVAVDLRGHGGSDAPHQEYTMESFADDVAWICAELGLVRPVVVGHSMGGVVAAVLAQRHPDLCGGIIILDSAIVPLPDMVEGLVGWVDKMTEQTYADELRAVSDAFFAPFDDAGRKRRVQERMVRTPQHVLVSSARHLGAFVAENVAAGDNAIAASWEIPVCFVAGLVQMNDMARFNRICPRLMTGQTVGSGHYITLEVPDQVNAMIERFLVVKDAI